MKKMKKLFAVLLTLAMVMGMTMTTMAADSATITLSGFEKANEVKYLQIIAPDRKTTSGWAFVNGADAAFKEVLNETDDQKIIWGLIQNRNADVKLPTGVEVKTVTAADIDKALSKIASLKNYTVATNKSAITVDSAGVYAITAVEDGYTYKTMTAYVAFGKASDGTYPALADTEVIAKKSSTTVDKSTTDEDHVAAIGDIVTYTITAYVPYIDANKTENRTFKIVDTITGADYYLTGTNAVATVVMGDSTSVGGTDPFAVATDGKSFTVDLSELVEDITNPNAGQKITITYTAKVNATTVTNKAGSHIADTVVNGTEVKLYSGKIILTKYDDNKDEPTTLANAEFEVNKKNSDGSFGEKLTFTKDESTGVYKYDPTSTNTVIVTGGDGTVTIEGLDVGTYHFTETKAPEGYSINTDGVDVELKVTGEATEIIENSGELTDTKLSALPSTGGIGTTIFTVAGCAIMIAAAALFFANRKKEQQ